VTGQLEAKLTEDLGLVVRVGVAQDACDVGELVDDGPDLCLGHALAGSGRGLAQAGLIPGPFGFGFGDPRGDRGGTCSGVEGGVLLG